MQYNSGRYNEHQYNVDFFSKSLTDSISVTDATISKSIGVVKLDSSSLSDSINKYDALHALLDSLTLTDNQKSFVYLVKNDSLVLSDTLLPFSVLKSLTDSINMTETIIKVQSVLYQDTMFLDENFTKQITNKGLFDTIRTADWVQIEPIRVNEWTDEGNF
jgi:hypothetical protein